MVHVDISLLVYLVLTAVIWSFNPAIIYRFARRSPPFLFTSTRALFAIVFISAYLSLVGFKASSINSTILLLIVLSAILGPGLGDVAYTKSIQLVGGSLAIIISYLYIFFAQVFTAIFLNERLGFNELVGATLAFLGVVIATYGQNSRSYVVKTGVLLALLAAVLWGAAVTLLRVFRDYVDAYTVSLTRLLVVLIFTAVTSLALHEPLIIDKGLVVATLFTGVLGWGVGMVLFTYSIYTLGVSATVVATALAPVLSQVTTRLVAGERWSLRTVLGALLVSIGIVVHML